MQLGCGGEGGEAEAGLGGVLEVGAGVREEDEGHCFFCGFECGGELARGPLGVCLDVRRGRAGGCLLETIGFWRGFSIVRRVEIGRMMGVAGVEGIRPKVGM